MYSVGFFYSCHFLCVPINFKKFPNFENAPKYIQNFLVFQRNLKNFQILKNGQEI
jgi:hypothetical protein